MLEAFRQAHLNEAPSSDELERIWPVLQGAREALRGAPDACGAQGRRWAAVLASCCASAAGCGQLQERPAIVGFLREVLLEAACQADSAVTPDEEAAFEQSQTWGLHPRVEAAEGLLQFVRTTGSIDGEIEETLKTVCPLG